MYKHKEIFLNFRNLGQGFPSLFREEGVFFSVFCRVQTMNDTLSAQYRTTGTNENVTAGV